MRLSWNEVRARAAVFATEWESASYERGETQSFYNDFFQIFGVRRRQVATFEEPVKKLGDKQGFIDLLWKGVLLVEHKSAGRNLTRAKEQALDYFPGLKSYELPRYVLVSDFQTFDLHDLDTGEALSFRLADLPAHVERFGFVMGVERRTFRDQDPSNVLASELMAKVHDALKDSGYVGHELERYLGSGLIDHSQKMTVAASAIADMKVCAQRSYRVWMRRQSLRRPNMFSTLWRWR